MKLNLKNVIEECVGRKYHMPTFMNGVYEGLLDIKYEDMKNSDERFSGWLEIVCEDRVADSTLQGLLKKQMLNNEYDWLTIPVNDENEELMKIYADLNYSEWLESKRTS